MIRAVKTNSNGRMARRDFLAIAGAGTLLAGCSSLKKEKKRPNVIFVFADQWRASAAGYAGDPNVKTPCLDALAAESVNFKNAVACCPVCSPARGSMVTGQYPNRNGVFLNDVCLNHNQPSVADCFNEAGYTTGFIGKWHLDGHGRSTYIPPERRQGFQYWKALECTHNYNQSSYYDNNCTEIKQWDAYDVFSQTEDAVHFVQQNRSQQFLLFLSWGPPHDPYLTAPEEFRKMYDQSALQLSPNVPVDERDFVPRTPWEDQAGTMLETVRLISAGYYAHCTALDHCIGRLQAAIRQEGLEEDTIFVFTSDHGDMLGAHGLWNKQQPYDESVRVPFLLKYPALTGRRGTSIKTPINTPDIMPTLCDLCGIPVPPSVDGRSRAPLLRGEAMADDGALIANYHAFGQMAASKGGKEWRGIRTSRYTYVKDLKGPWLLFDNQNDPWQKENLVNRYEAVVLQAQMEKLLSKKLAETGDMFAEGMEYVRLWNYKVDKNGTVEYQE